MLKGEIVIFGRIVQGFGYASGSKSRSGIGTIARQKNHFKAAGVSRADSWYEGTVNIDIAPHAFKLLEPDYVVTAEWKPGVTETFWLVDIVLQHNGSRYPAYIYYPCPSPVKIHPETIIEVLAEKIKSLRHGDETTIRTSNQKVEFEELVSDKKLI